MNTIKEASLNKSDEQTVKKIQLSQEKNEIGDFNSKESNVVQDSPEEDAANINNQISAEKNEIVNLNNESNVVNNKSKKITANTIRLLISKISQEKNEINLNGKESIGVKDNPKEDAASNNNQYSQEKNANLSDKESNKVKDDSKEVVANRSDQLINQQAYEETINQIAYEEVETFQLTLVPYANKLGKLSLLFEFSIGLYPMIINALRNDEDIKEDIDIAISFNSWLYYGAFCGVCATAFDYIFERPRKLLLYLSGFLSLLGLSIMLVSPNYKFLLVGRFIVGVGMGIHAITFYCYLYECLFGLRQVNVFLDEVRTLSYKANTRDLLRRALFILILGYSPWKIAIALSISFNIYALVSLNEFIESPYILIRKGEIEQARRAISQLTEMTATETEQYLEMEIKKQNELLRILKLIYPIGIPPPDSTFYVACSFIIHEFTGMTIIYIYMLSLVENEIVVYFIVAVIAEIIFFMWSKWKPHMEQEHFNGILVDSSFKMGIITLVLGILIIAEYYIENLMQFCIRDHLVFNILKLFILHCYFKSYATGLMYGDHILFVRETCDKFKKLTVAAILCKYIAIIILIQLFYHSNWTVGLSLTAYSAIALLYSLGLAKASH